MSRMKFTTSVSRFAKEHAHIPAHDPQLIALKALADILDTGEVTAALINQFALIVRALEKKSPSVAADDDDELLEARD